MHETKIIHSIYEAIPFLCIILSISFWPLINGDFWHKNSRKILFSWVIMYVLMQVFCSGITVACFSVCESLVKHYIPFILLIASLFIVTGGIYVDFPKIRHGALTNSVFLFLGSVLAGWIGTTGAASLLIRPMLRLNEHRKYRTHVIMFFILLIANVGGVASPIGDPPLYIGYLEGMDFFWPIKNLWHYLLLILVSLCLVFFVVDKYLWRKEDATREGELRHGPGSVITLHGKRNIVLLFSILASLVFCKVNENFEIFGMSLNKGALVRDFILLLICFLGGKFYSKVAHQKNEFSYAPLIEVVEIFLAIFITVAPLLDMLELGFDGPFSPIFQFIAPNGEMSTLKAFFGCGLLSSLLDNSPTFLIFFYMAGGDAIKLMGESSHILKAIVMSSVFMGGLTYIGNAPNFVVKSIAVSNGVCMPGFLKYILISGCILLPVFIVISLLL